MIQQIKNIFHLGEALTATAKFRFPAKKLTVIGVTGTDGKTTTTNLIYHILEYAGKSVSVISTIGARIHGKDYDIGFHVTTPSSQQLQKFLHIATKPQRAQNYMVLEVTSHALDQHRTWGIPFTIGVLTNISHEHLDYHKTYQEYVKTKLKLLKRSKIAIVNKDDESYALVKKDLIEKNKKYITYGLSLEAMVNSKNFSFSTQLLGEFNKYNCLAAVAVCQQIGINDKIIKEALATFVSPVGRQEIAHKKDFTVMVDFAHTPNSFEKILPEAKKLASNRLIHVFGAAGKRDSSKRIVMGKASSSYADIIILTSEDPRTESVDTINAAIIKGIQKPFVYMNKDNYKKSESKKNIYFVIPDREKAIAFAISLAKTGDVIAITGKSHEKSMNYGDGEKPWDEFEVIRKSLRQYHA